MPSLRVEPREDDGLGVLDAAYAEDLYARFARDPLAVPESWRRRFVELQNGDLPDAITRAPALRARSLFDPAPLPPDGSPSAELQRLRLERLVRAFLEHGHRAADLDPLGGPRPAMAELDPASHGFSALDLERSVEYDDGRSVVRHPLHAVVRHLRESYCGTLAVELAHLRAPERRDWLRQRIESRADRARPSRAQRQAVFRSLTEASALEQLLRRKRPGAKTYSLAGVEALMPLLAACIEQASLHGTLEVVLAMQHRGRLNVLVSLLRQPARVLFREPEDAQRRPGEAGDVPYHRGAHCAVATAAGRTVALALCFNPSHLEAVGPVALGRVRARQDRARDRARAGSLAILLHGDASLAGQGVVAETLNLAPLPAYDTGGALHIAVDNQLGFTTPPEEGRALEYSTSAALACDIPVLHVNAQDPDAVVRAARIALDYRQRFQRDVCLRLVGFRRFGHNEIDEPRFTQPVMYARIDATPSPAAVYRARLLAEGDLDEESAARIEDEVRAELDQAFGAAEAAVDAPRCSSRLEGIWEGFHGGPVTERDPVATAVGAASLRGAVLSLARLPDGFELHPKVAALLERRRAMARGERPFDWATAELAALATLALEGVPVRLTGQDTERGTFSQRHAVLHDQANGARHAALAHLSTRQADALVANSPLSELAALGFEYGYSLDRPEALVLWEAQFGDFVNGADVVLDQFLSSAEDKWRRLSGLVLLLPHGFEGQGPEHSSARLERFLTLAAEDNLQIVQPTTPAQMFHVLRRQALQRWKKPLVVLTPKSLLRHPRCVSALAELAGGTFQPVLAPAQPPATVERVLLASGRLSFELEAERAQRKAAATLLLRLEELYPLPEAQLKAALAGVPPEAPVVFVQDEPENMGAWRTLRARFPVRFLGHPFLGVARPPSASPATGWSAVHKREQRDLLERAFGDLP